MSWEQSIKAGSSRSSSDRKFRWSLQRFRNRVTLRFLPRRLRTKTGRKGGSDSGYPGRYLFSDYADYSGRRMVKVLLSILVLFELIDKTGNLYYFLRFIADASCYFLPVFLAAFAAGKSYQRDSGFRRPGCRRSR